MSCITKIKSALESMTATEQMIGRYILEHRHEVLEMNTLELGWASGTSGAAWTRFAKKMGYKGLPALTWDDASYSAGQEALKGLLKNWDSNGMVARGIATPEELVNKFLGNANAEILLSSHAVSGSVSFLQKSDSTYYWKITINQSADTGSANDGFQPLPAQDGESDAASSHEALIEELNSRPLEWNN